MVPLGRGVCKTPVDLVHFAETVESRPKILFLLTNKVMRNGFKQKKSCLFQA